MRQQINKISLESRTSLTQFKWQLKPVIFLIILFIVPVNCCLAQSFMKLVALESTRKDVERILGKRDTYFSAKDFATYGSYRSGTGKFAVWYSTGKCGRDDEGRQYKVRAKLMIALWVSLNDGPLLNLAVPNLSEFTRRKSIVGKGFIYTSKDESVIYETSDYMPERIKTIIIVPRKDKQYLLCKGRKLK